MPLRTVAIIPARDEEHRLPETLAALSSIPSISHLLVVDDGSVDATSTVARASGAEVISSAPNGAFGGRPLGKGVALAAGFRRIHGYGHDTLLLADADLGTSAANLTGLLNVLQDSTPIAIAAFPKSDSSSTRGGFGLVKNFARKAIARRNTLDYVPSEPLSGQRALLVPALESLPGLAPGFGVEVGMTLDLLSTGIRPLDLPLPLNHRPTGRSISGFVHRARQGADILRALNGARVPWQ